MISWHRSLLPMVENSPWVRHYPSFDGFRGSAAACVRYFPSFGGFRWPDTGRGDYSAGDNSSDARLWAALRIYLENFGPFVT